jgi:hypothetical protein
MEEIQREKFQKFSNVTGGKFMENSWIIKGMSRGSR